MFGTSGDRLQWAYGEIEEITEDEATCLVDEHQNGCRDENVKKHITKFNRRHRDMPSNIGDPMPHGASNESGKISTYTESNFPASAEAFIKDSRQQTKGK